MQYITVNSIKRNLGFKGLESYDFLIAVPLLLIFFLMFSFTPFKIQSISIVAIVIFLLLPINVSQKNRMYKVLLLIFSYVFRKKEFIFIDERRDSYGFKGRKDHKKV